MFTSLVNRGDAKFFNAEFLLVDNIFAFRERHERHRRRRGARHVIGGSWISSRRRFVRLVRGPLGVVRVCVVLIEVDCMCVQVCFPS